MIIWMNLFFPLWNLLAKDAITSFAFILDEVPDQSEICQQQIRYHAYHQLPPEKPS